MTIAGAFSRDPTCRFGFFVDLGQGGAAGSRIRMAFLSIISQSTAMSMPIIAAALFAAFVACLPAQAQYLGLGIETNIELTKHDLEIIHQTVDEQVHGRAVGTTAKWNNPDSGNYGKIQLLKKFVQDGRPCESVEYAVGTKRLPVRPEHYVLNSCLQPDGKWRVI